MARVNEKEALETIRLDVGWATREPAPSPESGGPGPGVGSLGKTLSRDREERLIVEGIVVGEKEWGDVGFPRKNERYSIRERGKVVGF